MLTSADYFYIIWFFSHFVHFFYSTGFYCHIVSIITHLIDAQVVIKIHIQAHNNTIQKVLDQTSALYSFIVLLK